MINNWNTIKDDYLNSSLNLKEIAAKYSISPVTLSGKIKKENWKELKSSIKDEYLSRSQKILDLSDRALDKVGCALSEIDQCIVKTKERTKTVEYDDDLKKPISETVDEKEHIEVIDGMIDTNSLKQLVSTLKDIKDIHLSFDDSKTKSENEEETGVVVIAGICADASSDGSATA